MDSLLSTLLPALFSLAAIFSPAPEQDSYFGYAEGEYLYIAARQDGYVEEMAVQDGQEVEAGDLLFALDRDRQLDAVTAAEAALAARKADLANKSLGARAEELAVIEAKKQKAAANLALARVTFNRTDALVARHALPKSRRDEDLSALNEAEAALRQYTAELAAAKLAARSDELDMVRQNIKAAEAELATASADLADRTLIAPTRARVDRVFLYPGEFAKAGTPVLSLLPPDRIKLRFFLPESRLADVKLGDLISVGCSGCSSRSTARISYISPEVEFTPPVIFSREERSKLVFMVEAVPDDPAVWHPGQPIDVRLQP